MTRIWQQRTNLYGYSTYTSVAIGLFYITTRQCLAFEVTDSLIDRAVQEFAAASNFADLPYLRSASICKDGTHKGILIDMEYLKPMDKSATHIANLQAALENNLRQKKKVFDGLIFWFWDGFYFKYIFRTPDHHPPIVVILDRKSLFGDPNSELVDYQSGERRHKIGIKNYILSFDSKGTELSSHIVPGHPFTKTICGTQYRQEWFGYEKGPSIVTVSIFRLNPFKPQEDQTHCIINSDIQPLDTVDTIDSPYQADADSPRFNFRYTIHFKKEHQAFLSKHYIVDDTFIHFAFSTGYSENTTHIEREFSDIAQSIIITPAEFSPQGNRIKRGVAFPVISAGSCHPNRLSVGGL